ncbi:hypothetical protein EBESD8_5280 [Rhodococcus aetherivorans]|nr:hypothetical protein EBESD8_5280 [Rhodococcus aetherivorans]
MLGPSEPAGPDRRRVIPVNRPLAVGPNVTRIQFNRMHVTFGRRGGGQRRAPVVAEKK